MDDPYQTPGPGSGDDDGDRKTAAGEVRDFWEGSEHVARILAVLVIAGDVLVLYLMRYFDGYSPYLPGPQESGLPQPLYWLAESWPRVPLVMILLIAAVAFAVSLDKRRKKLALGLVGLALGAMGVWGYVLLELFRLATDAVS